MNPPTAALFDSGAIYAFARLAQFDGADPLKLEDLPIIERYVRTFVLHDRVYGITEGAIEYAKPTSIDDLKELVQQGMKADRAEVRSVLLTDGREKTLLKRAEEYPAELFKDLDAQWQEYAKSIDESGGGLLVPPVLSIIVTRCARRDAIMPVLTDLRDEWAVARRKVWDTLDALRNTRTLGEAIEIRRELRECSKLFSPQSTPHDTRPVRVLWELFAAGAVGFTVAATMGSNPVIGAIAGALAHTPRSIPALIEEFGPAMFGRSGFDLARRIRRASYQVDVKALERLLTSTEKKQLGFE